MPIGNRLLCHTPRKQTFYRSIRSFATPLATLFILTVAIDSGPARARYDDFDYDFKSCGQVMSGAGIPAQVAADSCAAALYPKELGLCVYNIYKQTNITPGDALSTCRQVRRPRDLGRCVVNISLNTRGGAPFQILDNCRRSLLPVRFSECVVDLTRTLNVSPTTLMQDCIDGSDRPQDFYPPSGLYPIAPPPPNRQLILPPGQSLPPSGPIQVPAPPPSPQ